MFHLNTIEPETFGVLQQLFAKNCMKNFALAGVTGLALHLGHRKNVDIDLFTVAAVDMMEVSLQLQNDFDNITLRSVSNAFIFGTINNGKSDFVQYAKFRKSLQYFEDADMEMGPEVVLDYPDWKTIKNFISEKIRIFKI